MRLMKIYLTIKYRDTYERKDPGKNIYFKVAAKQSFLTNKSH